MADDSISRRRMLQLAAAAAVVVGANPRGLGQLSWGAQVDAPSSNGLRTHVTRPYDAETDVAVFREWLTPNEKFFVRSHFGPPAPDAIDPARWRLSVSGLVDTPLDLTLSDLNRLEQVTITAVLQCSGNGRANQRPRVPGVQWERGAVGNARWTGVRLRDVLEQAGLDRSKAKHVQLEGADRPVSTKTPLFFRSIPMVKALHPATLVVYRMNDEPLPVLHGGPLRLVTPGWMADSWTKWLAAIRVQGHEAEGYYMQTAYRHPTAPVESGASVSGGDMVPVEEMIVKSLIVTPGEGAEVSAGPVTIAGVAWTGEARVTRVEVSMDDGRHWKPATLLGNDVPYAWRRWEYRWDAAASGPVTLLCRATDSRGDVQPERSSWNPGGFLWNGWDRVSVTVAA